MKKKSTARYKIYFALTGAHIKRVIKGPAVILIPSSDKWNDFSYRTLFSYVIEDFPETVSGELHLAFIGSDESPSDKVQKLLSDLSDVISAKQLPEFYTIHLNVEGYRSLVRNLGAKRAKEFLVSINDLVALKQGRIPKWFSTATRSRTFALSFMRNAETFFAFHNAGSVLGGREETVPSGMSEKLQLEFKLSSFENSHQLHFSFEHDSILPKRIVVIIGKNGTGKSQALSHFAKSLMSDDQRLRDANSSRPSVHRLLAVSSPGETYTTFPRPSVRSRIDYRRIFLSRYQYGSNQSGFGDVLIQLARSEETVRAKDRWTLFSEAVSSLIPPERVFVKVSSDTEETSSQPTKTEAFPLTEMTARSEERRLELWRRIDPKADVFRFVNGEALPLSSGELTFVRFAAQACLHIENGTMLLFDEPETHLHPNLITEFIKLLDKLLELTSSFAVLATHSAYFVREVPASQVIILREPKPGEVEVVTPRLKTLGADIGSISFFVFGDDLHGRLVENLSTRLKRSRSGADDLLFSIENELPPETVMYLRRQLKPREQS